jgi:protein-tyrosine kinase
MERIKRALERACRDAAATGELAPQVGRADFSGARARSPHTVGPGVLLRARPDALVRHRIIAGDKRDPHTVVFDLLRTRILKEMQAKGWRVLGVTSPTPDCGKTTVALNLALSIARQSSPKVLLADFDLRRPKVAEYLGIAPEHDLSDFLEGRSPLSAVLVDPGIPRLTVLPNCKTREDATETLTKPETQALLRELKAADEDLVLVIDLPPVLNTDDTLAFLPQVDCILLVVAERQTRKPDVEAALRSLQGTNLIGTVLNKSDIKQPAYY